MLQNLIVALMVLVSAWVVARKYLPKLLRRRIAGSAGKVCRQVGLARLADWLEADLPAAASCGDGCGSCRGCAPTPVAGAGAGAGAVAGEFRISVESLRKSGRQGPGI